MRFLLCLVAAVSPLAACSTPGGPPLDEIAPTINATLEPTTGAVVPGDKLEVKFVNKLEWNQTVEVQSDGTASFLAIDKQLVGGLLADQIDAKLTSAYAAVLPNSDLTVIVSALGARSVSVLGDVENPGAVAIEPGRHLTLVEAIARSGGFVKATAYLSNTMLVRWDARTSKQIAWTIDARPEHWDGVDTILLQPYDVVYVPNTPIDEVAIWVDNWIRRMIPFPYLIVR